MRLYGEDGQTEPLLSLDAKHDIHLTRTRHNEAPNHPGQPERAGERRLVSLSAIHAGTLSARVEPPPPRERPVWISLARRNGTFGHPLSIRAIAQINERRLGVSKVHTLRHTFARGLEDAGAKVSEIQARLGHADLGTTGRYLAQLHAGENPHLARLSHLYGLEDRLKRQPQPPHPASEDE
ncbi:MAG TPA: tyrosine-type recombinase/integrase [Ktedonobacterales bacterium]